MQEKIKDQIKDAMRARDEVRLTTLRGVLAAFTNELVAKGKKPNEILTDEDCISVLRRLVKQRKDSIEQFEKGQRTDLADNERSEMKILEEFLPAQMSEEKIREIVMKTLRQAQDDNTGSIIEKDPKSIGKLMGLVMKETKGQADGTLVKKIVEESLS